LGRHVVAASRHFRLDAPIDLAWIAAHELECRLNDVGGEAENAGPIVIAQPRR
jgi:hypothetical protein